VLQRSHASAEILRHPQALDEKPDEAVESRGARMAGSRALLDERPSSKPDLRRR